MTQLDLHKICRVDRDGTLKRSKPSVIVLLVTAVLFALLGFNAAHASLSPRRAHGTPGALYLRAAQKSLIQRGLLAQTKPVLFEKTDLKDAHWERVPAIDAAVMQTSFEFARDEKPHFDEALRPRRATWLYPDDGCFVRAVVAADLITKKSTIAPMKIFAFGTLKVKTTNSPGGEVEWWYHVAPITKVVDASTGSEKFYVYDPAIHSQGPMEVNDWLKTMNDPAIDVAICATDAYDPDSDCATGEPNSLGRAQTEASWFLPSEWSRLEELGRSPKDELGAKPPWL